MAIKNPSRSTKKQLLSMLSSYPAWAHPDVLYNEKDWRLLRHAYDGERAVKEEGNIYLPKMASMDDDEYETYIDNATYFNMTYRTVSALVGTVFRRNPVISDLPASLNEKLKTITKRAHSLRSLTQDVAREIIHMGRAGVLVDTEDGGDPYLVTYITESIVDWDSEVIDGREVLTKVVLMELTENEPTETTSRSYTPLFRVLVLEDGVYKQKIYEPAQTGSSSFPSVQGDPTRVIIPTMRGRTLDYIPFIIFGATKVGWEVQRSPVLDIAQMNMSHYRSYAQLEQGRYYTGFPVFWATKSSADQTNEYEVGPSRVWELPTGEKAGLMEFNGQGLKFLENAIETKQGHIAALGGRMIGVETQAVSESDNQVAMKDRNEQAMLLNLTLSMDEGFTTIMQIWAEWSDTSSAEAVKISIEFNKDFLLKEAAAREFRAIHAMWLDGLLPIEVVFDYLKKAEVIPDWLEIEEFKRLLESESSFINNPDIEAKKEGFPDAKTKLELEESEKDRQVQQQQQRQADLLMRQQQQQQQTPPQNE